jgi:DNA-binding HxlR family transcriptional regulator
MGPRLEITGFEGCALPSALEVMGERWSFLLLRAAVNGIVHFDDFQASLGIARNILSNRLAKLVENGILSREPVAEDKRKVAYRLTEKGRGLLPAMIALRQWGEKWGEKWDRSIPSSPVLADCRDRKPIRDIAILSSDGRVLDLDDLCWVDIDEIEMAHTRTKTG